jgi:hypothetical protein
MLASHFGQRALLVSGLRSGALLLGIGHSLQTPTKALENTSSITIHGTIGEFLGRTPPDFFAILELYRPLPLFLSQWFKRPMDAKLPVDSQLVFVL